MTEENSGIKPENMEKLRASITEMREKLKDAREAMQAGAGKLTLEKPILSGDEEITELEYDFMALTGLEYADAMDSDPNANNGFKITHRQALALFAKAAAKQSPRLDMDDIMQRLGVTDTVEGSQLAMLFFNASSRAGQMRISKK